ncbi:MULTISPECIES: cyd operon YbgE family protein [Giesbergeria]|uniref:Cyd operon YbgE family protein n=1 Tax=Giesbergeria sinuosa TaxID=80883 RepID=A0ABV9QF94_9BURK
MITPTPTPQMHWPCLTIALFIMVAGSIYPLLFANAQGRADHGLAVALFWAMSAGLVRGVGFIPSWWLWRWLFSGWALILALGLATAVRVGV